MRRPTGFLKNYLDDLKIKCDHHDRGCSDVVRLENLQRHVDQCEFAPVKCENEECEEIINARDKENHEKNLCQFRIIKCHDCKDIKVTQDEIRGKQNMLELDTDMFSDMITKIFKFRNMLTR